MSNIKVRSFRKSLRKFERLNQLINTRCCPGITQAQCQVLLEIEELETATTNQLVKNLKLDKSTLSRTVDNLVKLGLVNRAESPDDRRYKKLILTAEGKRRCDTINRENDALYENMFARLNQNARDPILNHFNELIRAMENWYESGDESKCCGDE